MVNYLQLSKTAYPFDSIYGRLRLVGSVEGFELYISMELEIVRDHIQSRR